MWFEDGDGKREFLHPLAIEGFCIEGLLDYQFRQITCNTFEMYAQGALNKSNSREVMALLTGLNEKGQSILMVTHDVRAAI